ncbi:substrate-binding domain-containing protein [Rhodovulum sulfidophilum]|uniref:substrate-binding domain-containing protein n=1 Tax=Rhodovulum sulfidophilum TaxID=35806 RepID=UPI0019216A00|nr:substrate-binding domain-containing protein [Rhodovulum sulfidophilum]MBL3562192.1 substrate-binding domain-containing protein [Rhodovulum sulfidophilum]
MRFLTGAVLFCAALFLSATRPASAGEVTLVPREDGAVEIGGRLLGFDGEVYRLDTIYGPLAVNAAGVTCAGAACPGPGAQVTRIALSGSPALADMLMPALIEGFAAARGLVVERGAEGRDRLFRLRLPDGGPLRAEIALASGSTGEGFADLLTGAAQIVMADREILPEEIDRAREAGLGDLSEPFRRRIVALDAIVPVVAPDTRLGDLAVGLSQAALLGLLTGEIADWPGLGGPEAPITVHLPGQAGQGLRQLPAARVLGGRRPVASARRHGRAAAVATAVAADPAGLGLARVSALGDAVQVPLADGCGTRLLASHQSVKTGDYPYVAPLSLYLGSPRLPRLARDFLDYLATPAAQIAIRRAGFVDLLRDEIPLGRQGDRLALAIAEARPGNGLRELKRLVATLGGAVRLSETFRSGPRGPDARWRANAAALAEALEAGHFDGRRLILAGFAEGSGGSEASAARARREAEAVRDAIRAAATAADFDLVRLEVAGFGDLLPVMCDGGGRKTGPEQSGDRPSGDWAQRLNRRVEVWLR